MLWNMTKVFAMGMKEIWRSQKDDQRRRKGRKMKQKDERWREKDEGIRYWVLGIGIVK